MFPEAQAHRTTCTRWLTKGGTTIPDVVSYLAKRREAGRIQCMEGEIKVLFFFF